MAADWKLVAKHFCTLCPLQSADVHQPNAEHCECFCSGKPNDWRCYHHPILCGDVKEDLLHEVATLKSRILSDLELLSRYSKIKCPTSSTVSRTTDKRSIHFCPLDDDSRDTFIELLENELILQRMCPTGELEELRQRLLEELLLDENLKRHLEKLEHCSHLEACLIALLHKVPCILHLEKRVGIKLLTMLLLEGFSNAQLGLIFSQIRSELDRIKAFAERIQEIFNTCILGDEDGPAQWTLPMSNDGKNVGIMCLDNTRIRKVIEQFEILVDVAVRDDARMQKYKYCIPEYRNGIELLRQCFEYSDEEIKVYQGHIDNWYQVWMPLHVLEGCTNFTHLLSSAHIVEYMFKWRNMYRFSQQGWENFNHVFSMVYFRRTIHGGKKHANAIKSKLVGIGRWLQRRLL
jgi:hypothetical protein